MDIFPKPYTVSIGCIEGIQIDEMHGRKLEMQRIRRNGLLPISGPLSEK